MNAISRLMRPASVAVIGASADSAKTVGRPVAYLRKHGFDGDIYPVNPRYETIDGLRCYPDVASLPHAPDVGIVLLGAERAHVAVRELASRGTSAAIVLASGYAETGEEGAKRQSQLDRSGRVHAPARAEYDRARQPDRSHHAVGKRRIGDRSLYRRWDRRGVAKRRDSWFAAVAGSRTRNRPVEARVDEQ